ncbi:MAG: SAP domain-containing protein [gamma proteobacterium symbiont of Bathyaustriella thionipta]|nr:SAP domain-containing protein [gamma proteobacterium symbiont of Bathyaustriella thionipta]MCU7949485.1 SAP domain-containing protein [gamma proteobacterium symbiont of Bathyaustriella thionipta]MCU7952422.1 SAP domain-containing protein [gamma proteobacterium symbiont of Bathyaustriella thionipta]MCU7956071.1 SAP domain-containing protein [gamma proteobacterium symbiont of Bathyaustriella thionipta]MCU7968365.1 SAP domain-containing protein [gamma proteobacterium symbiont of Bathyaustriella
MKVKDIQVIAKAMKLKVGKLNKMQLIQLIQKEENNNICYATPTVTSCAQDVCLWRTDCLKVDEKSWH